MWMATDVWSTIKKPHQKSVTRNLFQWILVWKLIWDKSYSVAYLLAYKVALPDPKQFNQLKQDQITLLVCETSNYFSQEFVKSKTELTEA